MEFGQSARSPQDSGTQPGLRSRAVPPPPPAAAAKQAPGLLNKRYRPGTVLATERSGRELVQAHDLLLDKPCSVKRSARGTACVEQELQSLRREVELGARLAHPHIVAARHVLQQEDGTPFLILEPLSGRTLDALLEETGTGRLSLQRTLEILRPAAMALQHAHDRELAHGSLTPSSWFLHSEPGTRGDSTPREVVKLLSSGGMRDLRRRSGATAPGTAGTAGLPPRALAYLAPEALLGAAGDGVDALSDQWSLAVLAYRMLSGQLPAWHEQPDHLIALIVSGQPGPSDRAAALGRLAPDVPEHVARALAKALSRDKSKRYASLTDFVRALDGLPVPGPRSVPSIEKTVQGERADLIALCSRSEALSDGVPVPFEEPTTRPYPNESFAAQVMGSSPPARAARPARSWLFGLAAALLTVGAGLLGFSTSKALSRRDPRPALSRAAASLDPGPRPPRELTSTPSSVDPQAADERCVSTDSAAGGAAHEGAAVVSSPESTKLTPPEQAPAAPSATPAPSEAAREPAPRSVSAPGHVLRTQRTVVSARTKPRIDAAIPPLQPSLEAEASSPAPPAEPSRILIVD